MRSVEEIEIILVAELHKFIGKVKSMNSESRFYNEQFGDTSFLLAGLLGSLMKLEKDWDSRKWIDDCLLTKVNLDNNRLSIWGAMIWGIESTTEQWTDPFCFEIELHNNEANFNEYTFLFCDFNKSEILYEEFSINSNYWDQSSERDWKYILNKKNIYKS